MILVPLGTQFGATDYVVGPFSWRTWSVSAILMLVVLPVITGTSFTREREDRSANFVAMLPVSHATRLVSKALLTFLLLLSLYTLNFLFFQISMMDQLSGWYVQGTLSKQEAYESLLYSYSFSLFASSVGWLFATFLSVPILSVGLGVGLGISTYVACIAAFSGLYAEPPAALTCALPATLLSACLAVAGVVIYCCRTRP
jgi:ABC-type transport system involved in multi-copper enzyme maturation permease subunit